MPVPAVFIRLHRVFLSILVVVAALLWGAATEALAQGTIQGRVTSSTTSLGLPNTVIQFYDFINDTGSPVATTTTDALGNYSISLPASSYGIVTQNTQGYINEIFDNISCSAVCDVESIVPVVLSNGGMLTADFVLDPGGRIAGRVTDAATGQGIAGVVVFFIDANGQLGFTSATTDANGDYISDGGTVTGTVFAMTMNTLGYQNEAWDDIKCPICDGVAGTPMPVTIGVTTGGFDFALDMGGKITGTVRDVNLAPLPFLEIHIYDSAGNNVDEVETDATGNFTSGGLPAGSYYVGTDNDRGLVDKLWNGITCINAHCDPSTMGGTLVPVTIGGTAGNIDFILEPGGRITGTITNAVGGAHVGFSVFVGVFDAAGIFIGGTDSDGATGAYSINGVPAGTSYLFVNGVPGFFNQLYNGLTCTTNCQILQSTPIHVVPGATNADVNFALVPTTAVGSISGTVRDTTGGLPGVAVNGLNVQVFSITGAQLANANTDAQGVYTFSNLAVASYYVRTNGGGQLINQLHSSVVCLNCTVTTSGGTPVPVTAGGTATVDFNLVNGGRISGTITNAAGGAALSGIEVQLFSVTGVAMGTYNTNAMGVFTTRGLPDGVYFLRATDRLGFFVNKLYDNLACPGLTCAVTVGTPVIVAGPATVGGKNFALSAGGRITGTLTHAVSGALLTFGVSVQVFTEGGFLLGNINPNASGVYTTFSLPAGRYYIRTSNSLGLIDELYDNLPCIVLCSVTAGTPIDVVVGATVSGRNFALSPGGNIAGTVRDAGTNALLAQIRVAAVLANGTIVKTAATNANGDYVILGLQPGTYYVRTSVVGGVFYLDELWNEVPCSPTCTVTAGTPVEVTTGVTSGGKNFTLTAGGGGFSGTVRDAATNMGLGGPVVTVQAFLPNGTLVKTVGVTAGTGSFTIALPAGDYVARTVVSPAGAYLDELFNGKPCTPSCDVTAGDPITVPNGATQTGIDFSLAPNLVRNGRFESGTSNWSLFATPDMSYIVSQVTGGVFEYYRVPPPPGTSNQAVIFQTTGAALVAESPLIARFSLGNSSSVRKRISVLVLDADFSDLSVCTFWLAPNSPLTPYQMLTHTTKAWTNAAIYFYAASAGTNGGFYQLDDVSIEHAPGEVSNVTNCVDPTAPVASGDPAGPEWLVNGNFNTGSLAPWGTFGQISSQITGGVFEFIKLPGTPAGVVLQPTLQVASANDILTATFQLGNSSSVRKRVTVIVHDNNFSDLSACTFWLAPNQPLATYTYRTFATQAWSNATFSVYPATTGADQWILLDNATLARTPGTSIVGTECIEPLGGFGPSVSATSAEAGPASAGGARASASREGEGFRPAADGSSRAWIAIASENGTLVLQRATALDLTAATSATLVFRPWPSTSASWGEVQVRGDDGEWTTVQVIDGSDDWTTIVVDLSAYLGQVVDVRFVFHLTGGG